jgi:RNA polymerase sigma factor (sigma-70 family)
VGEIAPSPQSGDPSDFNRTRVDLELWRAGDRAALDRVFRRYERGLKQLIVRRIATVSSTPTRLRLSADDLFQDAARVVLERIATFEYRGPGSLFGWMEAVAMHSVSDAVDKLQAMKRAADQERPLLVSDDDGTPRDQHAFAGAGPSTVADARERATRVDAALARLPERDHRLMVLRYYFGAEWEEIARELGAPSAEAVRKEHARLLPSLGALLRGP